MNKPKFLGSLLLASIGSVIAFYPFAPGIPRKSELREIRGILISSRYRSKIGSEIHIEGAHNSFVYTSLGRLCGNVHDQLLAAVGKPISIRYLDSENNDLFGNPRPPRVFEIIGQQSEICTYDQVAAMIRTDFRALPLIGYLALLIGCGSALSTLSRNNSGGTSTQKSWAEIRSELEAEEGERIIGDQRKNTSEKSTRSLRD